MKRQEAFATMTRRAAWMEPSDWLDAWLDFFCVALTKVDRRIDSHRRLTGPKQLEWDGCGEPPRPDRLLSGNDANIRRRLLAEREEIETFLSGLWHLHSARCIVPMTREEARANCEAFVAYLNADHEREESLREVARVWGIDD